MDGEPLCEFTASKRGLMHTQTKYGITDLFECSILKTLNRDFPQRRNQQRWQYRYRKRFSTTIDPSKIILHRIFTRHQRNAISKTNVIEPFTTSNQLTQFQIPIWNSFTQNGIWPTKIVQYTGLVDVRTVRHNISNGFIQCHLSHTVRVIQRQSRCQTTADCNCIALVSPMWIKPQHPSIIRSLLCRTTKRFTDGCALNFMVILTHPSFF